MITADGDAFAQEIQRLAQAMFAGEVPLSPGAPEPVLPAEMAPTSPPRLHPSALNVGAGGASPALMLPPIPGPMIQPPLAATPAPKESDFRPVAALLTDQLGLPSPFALAVGPTLDAPPYFLSGAGFPPSGAVAPSMPPEFPSPVVFGVDPTLDAAPYFLSSSGFPASGAAAPDAPEGLPASAPRPVVDRALSFEPEVSPAASPSASLFDPNALRREFPILDERIHGRRLVWLDNAATTQKPRAVIERISEYYTRENSNVHRAAHTLAARSTDAFEAAREKVRRFLNAPSAKDVVFVRGTTEAINLVAQSWGRRNVGPGDEIVISWLEHHANIVPWQQLCCEKGARLRVAPVDDRGQIILEQYERLLSPRTRLVSFTQVSNALGTVTPAREMIQLAHRHGARVLLDGAQAVSHMPTDVQTLDPDFYVFSGHKVFGPTGIGALYGKSDVLEAMPPWQGGGNMIADVTFEKTTYQPAPARFEAGTGNIADAVGLGAAIDWVTGVGLERIGQYEHELREYAEARLANVPGLRLVGTAADKAGVVSFVLDNVRTEEVGGLLNREGIAVRSGHHCAQPILRRFGLESTVRASLAPYNTREDIDALVDAVSRLQAGRPSVPT